MSQEKHEIVKFIDDGLELNVSISPNDDTVWLTQEQIANLFSRDKSVISRHIKNIFLNNELQENSCVAFFATELNKYDPRTKKNRITVVDVKYFNLDIILAVGYKVNSKRGSIFRKWASNILKEYMLKGYAINQKRLNYLEKQINLISIASRLDDKVISDEGNIILKTIVDYNKALSLLDDYDHQCLKKPDGTFGCYKITYEECRKIIDSMKFDSKVFGVEKDGSFNSSINSIYQSAFGEDVYKTVEEKAANLLYFITKNHSFVDGNKRIAASIFLYFLDMNNLLYINNEKIISDSALVAITILIAESKPEEKENIIDLIMNFLVMK